jgi:thiol:disulfide interchange protein
MPCIWPVLPLIVTRLVEQAKRGKGKSIAMGLLFCLGILLFFAALAGANIILHLFYGTVLQWGDQFRSPVFVTAMALLLVVLALFMFDVFTVTVPSSVAAKSGSGKGYLGAIGMGFVAAVLSTPCSFAILAAAFAWAQAQPLLLATVAIMVIGIGMAVPYLILVSIPGLLGSLPKPGKWMDIFKKIVAFILLGIAVWMITVLSQQRRTGLLYYSVILSFCVWMWGGWVGFGSKTSSKIIVRTIAVLLAVAAGYWLLSPPTKLIDWKKYDADLIEKSLADNKPVLIEFTAEWCLSCKVVGKLVYQRKDVTELIKQKGVVAIKADTTVKDYPATKALKNIYNEPGVPVSILFLPGQKEPVRWRGKAFGDELKTLLEKLP